LHTKFFCIGLILLINLPKSYIRGGDHSFIVFLFPTLSDSIFNVICNQAIALIYVNKNIFCFFLNENQLKNSG